MHAATARAAADNEHAARASLAAVTLQLSNVQIALAQLSGELGITRSAVGGSADVLRLPMRPGYY